MIVRSCEKKDIFVRQKPPFNTWLSLDLIHTHSAKRNSYRKPSVIRAIVRVLGELRSPCSALATSADLAAEGWSSKVGNDSIPSPDLKSLDEIR